MAKDSVTLWRPVGPSELALMRACGMRAFPPGPPLTADFLSGSERLGWKL